MALLDDNTTARLDRAHPVPDATERRSGDVGRRVAERTFGRYAWFVLLYNLLVIAVGTVVRATGSGDGCGAHWPLCDGEIIPLAPSVARIIEFTHRVVSGLDGLFVLALFIGGLRLFPRRHPVRPAVTVTLLLTLFEGFIGAYLVKQRLVADNATIDRAIWMSIHLCSTFFLLASLSCAVWFSGEGARLRLRGQGAVGWSLLFAMLSMFALGVSGAVTALGDTLFPARDHADALMQAQFGSHFLQQLRLLHPYIAGSVGLYLLLIAGLVSHLRPMNLTRRWSLILGYLFLAEIGAGLINVALRAPVWMQVFHLLLADFVWIALVFLAMSALAETTPHAETRPTVASLSGTPRRDVPGVTWRDYLELTKPKVIALLLITTLTAMVMAKGGWPGWVPFLATALGGYMAAGAAKVFNMVIDADVDLRMKRTAGRPTASGRIPLDHALYFAFALTFGSFFVLWFGANLLSAMLALFGLVFYVVVYSLLLKRRTWQNIVIGGAAGAFPPLVGWAAVTGDLKSMLAWYLFGIIFVWTPAHFWALALLIKEDYAEAGIPMAPVVLGDRNTVIQIGIYTILTAVASLAPLFSGFVGVAYTVAAVVLNLVFLLFALQLYRRTDRPHASKVFHYSMLYLALLFVALAIDRTL
ncbi:MAG: heme o synthase [Capsulimonadales bacterium]|nr:heme o synthase [Capsulimonadales bacterium]